MKPVGLFTAPDQLKISGRCPRLSREAVDNLSGDELNVRAVKCFYTVEKEIHILFVDGTPASCSSQLFLSLTNYVICEN